MTDWPPEQPDIEGRAREMLEGELANAGWSREFATCDQTTDPAGAATVQAALRAIAKALATTEIRREALEEALGGYHSLEAFIGNLEFYARQINALGDSVRGEFLTAAKVIRALACPPSRPSFDKWDFAAAVLKDNEGCGR